MDFRENMKKHKTEADLQKEAWTRVRKAQRVIDKLAMNPLDHGNRAFEFEKIRREIDRAWDGCRWFSEAESPALDQACKSLLKALIEGEQKSRELLLSQQHEISRSLRPTSMADRYFAELDVIHGKH